MSRYSQNPSLLNGECHEMASSATPCRKANDESVFDSGVDAEDGTYHEGEFRVSDGGERVDFYLDGVLFGTANSNIPHYPGDEAHFRPAMGCGPTVTDKQGLVVDYVYVRQDR